MRGLELSPVWHTAGISGGGLGGKTGHTTVTGELGARRGQAAAFPSPPAAGDWFPGSRFSSKTSLGFAQIGF